jgi:DNA-binding NtrC family response regulator
MRYLLYLRDEVARKFPLIEKTVILGRNPACAFHIDEVFISNEHAEITCFQDYIKVKDLDSKNHIFVNGRKIKVAKIKLNGSFCIGSMEFFLKEGNPEEFTISPEAWPVIHKRSTQTTAPPDKTKTYFNLFDTTLMSFLNAGCRLNDFEEILGWARNSLTSILKSGQLLILREWDKDIQVQCSLFLDEGQVSALNKLELDRIILNNKIINREIESDLSFYSFPIELTDHRGALFYSRKSTIPLEKKTLDFLEEFSIEVSFIYKLIEKNKVTSQDEKAGDLLPTIICRDKSMLNLLTKCKKIADSDLSILIQGETGTGKELIARFIHYHSDRKQDKYIAFNCSAFAENMQEDELFGHEKGAFTDAINKRTGYLDLSSGGTLVLDEIGDMSLSLQSKLLRALQENEFHRVGGDKPVKVNLRVISLTNKDIRKLMAEKCFREDLYYRIANETIHLPPLKERPDDILPLCNYFLKKFSGERGIVAGRLSQKAANALRRYPWPGNVRELEAVIKGQVSLSDSGNIIDFDILNNDIKSHYLRLTGPTQTGDGLERKRREKEDMERLLMEHHWNKSRVAEVLDISRTALYKKLKKLGIK